MPRKVLVLFAHPALEKSRTNRRLLEAVQGLSDVTVRDLYELYPALMIDVKAEQAALAAHDALIIQHPMYWYSTPPLVKEWQDLVLEHGWAYGTGGDALKGKLWMHVLSTGAPELAYSASGRNRFTIRQLLAPLELTATLCGMRFLAPFVVHGANAELDLTRRAAEYRAIVEAIRDDRYDLDAAERASAAPVPRSA